MQQSRLSELKNLQENLEEYLLHYKKIKKRWTKVDSSVKIIGVGLVGITSLTAAVVAPVVNIPILTMILSGIAAGKVVLTETISIGYTSKKVKQYREIIDNINYTINKLFLFNQKAMSDNILSIDEIKMAQKITKELKDNIKKIKNKLIAKH